MERSKKGESTLFLPESFVVLDLETTGFDPTYDDIIEIFALKVENMRPADTFHSLIAPCGELPAFITRLTGITDAMLADAPALGEILPALIDFIGDAHIIGHNVSFDVNFIYDAAVKAGLPPLSNDFTDTLRLCRRLFPDRRHNRLSDLIADFALPAFPRHRAEGDVMTTLELYKVLKQAANERPDNLIMVRSNVTHAHLSKMLTPDPDAAPDPDNPLFNRSCAFTGKLERFTRKEAMQIVLNLGGTVADGVTKNTNILVLANTDYAAARREGHSAKYEKAQKLILQGADLMILPETAFYGMIEDA